MIELLSTGVYVVGAYVITRWLIARFRVWHFKRELERYRANKAKLNS